MHELGILYNITNKVMEAVRTNGLTEVEAIVLQVGEQSAVVPHYLYKCYPVVVDGTIFENTVLEVEETTGREFLLKEIRAR
jgi:hydrogenase nickel incorporation protein HypA/HybF